MTATLVLALLIGGGGMLWWRPWRHLGGQHPRVVVSLVVASAAATWSSSLGLVMLAMSGEYVAFVQACESLWSKMATGQLTWREWSLGTLWAAAFPGRAAITLTCTVQRMRRLQRSLRCVATPLNADNGPNAFAVRSLGTPAVTVGLLRPHVLVDADFWRQSLPRERSVVLAHENAHRGGRHGVVELAAKALLSPLRPLPVAAAAYASLRVHLEALADDAAARTHGKETVGRTLGLLALARAPTVGLGMAGSSIWRVRRLLAADEPRGLTVLGILLASLVLLSTGVGVALYGATEILFIAATYCLL